MARMLVLFLGFCALNASAARADVCNCSQTGVCVCRPGTCMCPNCPGRITARPAFAPQYVAPQYVSQQAVPTYPVAAVYAVSVYQAAPPVVYQQQYYYAQPAQAASGCYWNGQQWICPNAMTGGQRRAYRRAERRGLFSSLFGE